MSYMLKTNLVKIKTVKSLRRLAFYSAFIALFLSIVSTIQINGLFDFLISKNKKFVGLKNTTKNHEARLTLLEWDQNGYVDLASKSIQELKGGFMVVGLEANQHLDGIKVTGRIINSSTLTYTSASFIISIGQSRQSFFISRISPANSSRFEVFVPNVAPENARFAKIVFENATVNYYSY